MHVFACAANLCAYVHAYMRAYMRAYLCACIRVCVCVESVFLCMCACWCVPVHGCLRLGMHLRICVGGVCARAC